MSAEQKAPEMGDPTVRRIVAAEREALWALATLKGACLLPASEHRVLVIAGAREQLRKAAAILDAVQQDTAPPPEPKAEG